MMFIDLVFSALMMCIIYCIIVTIALRSHAIRMDRLEKEFKANKSPAYIAQTLIKPIEFDLGSNALNKKTKDRVDLRMKNDVHFKQKEETIKPKLFCEKTIVEKIAETNSLTVDEVENFKIKDFSNFEELRRIELEKIANQLENNSEIG